jgi:hypothetical protein
VGTCRRESLNLYGWYCLAATAGSVEEVVSHSWVQAEEGSGSITTSARAITLGAPREEVNPPPYSFSAMFPCDFVRKSSRDTLSHSIPHLMAAS